jgi:hypothetical protein
MELTRGLLKSWWRSQLSSPDIPELDQNDVETYGTASSEFREELTSRPGEDSNSAAGQRSTSPAGAKELQERELVRSYRMETFGGAPLSDSEFSARSNIRLEKGQRWSWKLVGAKGYDQD